MPPVSEGSLWRRTGAFRHEGEVCPGCRKQPGCQPYQQEGWLCIAGDEQGMWYCVRCFNHLEEEEQP